MGGTLHGGGGFHPGIRPGIHHFHHGFRDDALILPGFAFPFPAPDASYEDQTVAEVQEALSDDGFYNGPIDGIAGPGTRAAVAAYQRSMGLPPTGLIDARLLNSLGVV